MEGNFNRQFIMIDFDTLEDEAFRALVGGVFAAYCLLRKRIWRSSKPDLYGLAPYYAQGDLCAALSQEELAHKLHTSERNARRFIKALKDQGLVKVLYTGRGSIYKLGEVVRVRTKEGEIGHKEIYYLDLLAQRSIPLEHKESMSALSGRISSAERGQEMSPQCGQKLSGGGIEKEIDKGVSAVKKAEGEVAYLTAQILGLCGDAGSRAFYEKASRYLPSDLIYRFLSEIRQDPRVRNRGAVFTTKVKTYLRTHPDQRSLRGLIGS